jgi:hypothetical protein
MGGVREAERVVIGESLPKGVMAAPAIGTPTRRPAVGPEMNGRLGLRPTDRPEAVLSKYSTVPPNVEDVDSASQPPAKEMRLRYPGRCSVCGSDLSAGTKAVYDRVRKTVRCVGCVEELRALEAPVVVDVRDHITAPQRVHAPQATLGAASGIAGSSARREYERRKSRREDRIRAQHPKLGGLILALSDDPQSTRAWDEGAIGEERLGARLDTLAAAGEVTVLHDRRIPGTRANIDHLVVAGSGVWVIDAKRYKGRPSLRVEGGILRPRVERLMVGRRDCTKLVDGVLKQVDLVRAALASKAVEAPLMGALAFVDADWPMIGGAFSTRGVHVLWPRRLRKLVLAPGQLEDIDAVDSILATHFPPA